MVSTLALHQSALSADADALSYLDTYLSAVCHADTAGYPDRSAHAVRGSVVESRCNIDARTDTRSSIAGDDGLVEGTSHGKDPLRGR